MPTRVLCCCGSLESGGSERQLWQLAVGLPAQQFAAEIYLIYRRGVYLEKLPPHIPVIDFASQSTAEQWRGPGSIHRQQVKHLIRTLRERQIDVVYDRTFHMTLLTSVACRATDTPRVSVIVSPPSQDFGRSPERFRWIKKRLLARAYRDQRSICLAVSDSVAQDAACFYGLTRSSIWVVPSPIDIDEVISASQANVLFELDPAVQTPTWRWVVVGRLSSEKGQRLAIRAMAKLRTIRPEIIRDKTIELVLIGAGPEREALVELVRQLGLQSSIRFAGQLTNPYPWMQNAELLCIPSLYEGLPNVALEAMCLHTPIVATDCSGSLRELLGVQSQRAADDAHEQAAESQRSTGEYIEGERGVLISIGDEEALARAVLDRFDRPHRWAARATAAGQWVRERHGMQPWLAQMQQLFQVLRKAEIRR